MKKISDESKDIAKKIAIFAAISGTSIGSFMAGSSQVEVEKKTEKQICEDKGGEYSEALLYGGEIKKECKLNK